MNPSDYILNFINQTNRSLFLTGKAGTGKTTLLHQIISSTYKNTIVVAPTGIAALNARGVTIHSLFQLPFASFLPTITNPPVVEGNIRFENRHSLQKHFKMHRNKRKIIINLELLIVDEVSMLRADVLDAMDYMLQFVRKNKQPFGGVQVLFVGDLLQLPPVVKNEEWNILQHFYKGIFFFHSKVIEQNPLLYIELDKVYRQSDIHFLSILNHLRNNKIETNDIQILNKYVQPNFKSNKKDGYITLTTHNIKADKINKEALDELPEKAYQYQAEIIDDFPEYIYPIDKILTLKKGAQVMFVKNDTSPEKRFFNGKIGTIVSLSEEEILVKLADENTTIEVQKYEWQNIRYRTNPKTNDIVEEILGTFTQYPLRIAWAITIHKSQGLTFDKAILDLGGVFAPGQAYVALSRLRSLNGLVLLSSISTNNIQTSNDVQDYAQTKANENTLHWEFSVQKKKFLEKQVISAFDWEELSNKWFWHANSYKAESERSNKSKYKDWAKRQTQKINEIIAHSRKFLRQLQSLFAEAHIDLFFILERFEKAKTYFFPVLDDLTYQVLRTQAEVSSSKNVKQFREELAELEEIQTQAVFRLLKTEVFLKAICEDENLTKESLSWKKISDYKSNLLQKIYDELSIQKLNLEQDKKQKNKKTEKTGKIATQYQTWELWKKKIPLEEIARERKLSLTTIYRHLGLLVKEGKIQIDEILSSEKIRELAVVFEKAEEETTLTQIKEQVGETFSWEELKLFKNFFNKED